MAIAQVNVLALASNQLPDPNNAPGGTYMGGTIMASSNIVVVNTALAINAAFAERDKKIGALQRELDELRTRLAASTKSKARNKTRTPGKKRGNKNGK